MMKNNRYFLFPLFFFLCNLAIGQKIDSKVLVKNMFLMEPIFRLDTKEVDLNDFNKSFDFKMYEIGNSCRWILPIQLFVLDSFKVYNKNIVREELLKDSVYVVAVQCNDVYRLKGFSYNDFPFLLKYCLENKQDYSVNEILKKLEDSYNTKEHLYVDFECLYEAFRSKEINYDIYPCLESLSKSLETYIIIGYNEKVYVKKGGEPIGYRRTKYKVNKYRKRMRKVD